MYDTCITDPNDVPNDGEVYEFRYRTMKQDDKYPPIELLVYAESRYRMEMFLKQHGFNLDSCHIDIVKPDRDAKNMLDRYDINEDRIIQPYIFYSNKTKQNSIIYTTQVLVERFVSDVCTTIVNESWFDAGIIRTDIPFIKKIVDLIESLRYGIIAEYGLIDRSEIQNNEVYSYQYLKEYSLGCCDNQFDCIDDSCIFEAMELESYNGRVQPITIEAYVKNFVRNYVVI